MIVVDARGLPVIYERGIIEERPLLNVRAEGDVLRVCPSGVEYGGWKITWPQIILALQDAARGTQYEMGGDDEH